MGIPVKKDSLPTVINCPLCGQPHLRIYNDPNGGAWYSCRACGELDTDSIGLFAAVNNLKLKAAVKAIAGCGLFSQPVIAASSIEEYVAATVRRKKISDFWRHCRLAVRPKSPHAFNSVLQKLHIASNWEEGWQKGLGRYVGACSKKMILQAFPNVGGNPTASAVLPFQDVPGRVSSFLLLSRGDIRVYTENNDTPEDGLFMLDSTTPCLPTVYAFKDALAAMYAQRKCLMDSNVPAPIVAWGPNTNRAWEAIRSSRIVFWSNGVDIPTLLQARRVEGYIATRPYMKSKTAYEFIRAWYGINSMLNVMNEHALYWLDAVKEFMLKKAPPEVAEMLCQLSLTANEKQDLMSRCHSSQASIVSEYLGDSSIPKSVTVDEQIVTEHGGIWKIRSHNGGPERTLCDAIIRLNKILSYPNGKKFYSGVVEFHGKSILFTDPMERVSDKTYAWLNDKTVEAGVGSPEVLPNWHRRLLAVAKAFENPKVIIISDKVGMNGDVFNFPSFTIQGGAFITKPDVSFAKHETPASTLEVPRKLTNTEVEKLIKHETTGIPEFWALMACITINVLNAKLDSSTPRRPIGLIGAGAVKAGNLVAKAYELLVENLSSPYWHKHITAESEHALPILFKLDPKHSMWKRIAKWRTEGHDNIITAISAGAGACMSVTDNWVFIHSESELDDFPDQDTISKMLPLYIAHLQTQNFELPDEYNLWYRVLEDMCCWLSDTYPEYGNQTPLFDAAKQRVRAGSPDGEMFVSNRFLWATIYLGSVQKLNIGEYDFHSDAVLVDREACVVHIDIDKLSDKLIALGIPVWNWPDIVNDLKQRNIKVSVDNKLGEPGVIRISKQLFDAQFKRFFSSSVLRQS